MKIDINKIIRDDDIYPRIQINHKAIESYVEALKTGAEFPSILVQKIKNSKAELIIILDGYHRNEAYKEYLKFVKENKTAEDEEDNSGTIWDNEIKYVFWKDEILDKKEHLNNLRIESIKRNLEHGIILKDEDKEAMCRLMAEGDIDINIKYNHFKDIFGVSQKTISNWINDIRTKQRSSRNGLIYRLSALGWTQSEIADKLNIHQTTVGEIKENSNFTKILNDWKSGKDPSELAEYYGLDIPTVWNILLKDLDDLEKFKLFGKENKTLYVSSKTKYAQPKIYDYWSFSKRDNRLGDEYEGLLWGQHILNILYRFTKQGELVIDPMAGGGSTIDACLVMGRECRAFDINPIRDDIEQNDIKSSFPETLKKADFIILDPPYYKKKEQEYECQEITKDRKTFMNFIETTAKNCHIQLKSNKYLAFLMSNYIDYENEEESIFGADYCKIFESIGFRLVLEIQTPLSSAVQYQAHDITRAKKSDIWKILPISRSWFIFKKVN